MKPPPSPILSRRVFLGQAFGWTLVLAGTRAAPPRRDSPYRGGAWLAGDHHVHTMFSPDGMYPIAEQVAQAVRHGLRWCVITDHGGPHHDKVLIEQAYPALLAARRQFPECIVFQGLEWNIPSGEHGSVIMPVAADEARWLAEFEARFDPANRSRNPPPGRSEEDAVAALRFLANLAPKPLFFANHPSRRGLDSPAELRRWSEVAPLVARGMEAAPGHQAATLCGGARGGYALRPQEGSFPGFPPEAYLTHGGFDWFVARVGGVWDSLLAEGRPWFVTANSDSHRHYREERAVDASTYARLGYVTLREGQRQPLGHDFWPGEYSETVVYAERPDALGVLDALRHGSMFAVHGDLIDRLEFVVRADDEVARMGETLRLPPRVRRVDVTVRVRVPDRANFGGRRPVLHRIDLIVGPRRAARDPNRMAEPATRVAATFTARTWRREGPWRRMELRLVVPEEGAFLRLRGTNRDAETPAPDRSDVDPWDDLWFYSNPIFVRPRGMGR